MTAQETMLISMILSIVVLLIRKANIKNVIIPIMITAYVFYRMFGGAL